MVFDYRKAGKSLRERMARSGFTHARYLDLYPVRSLVSLHEGGTPLVRSRNLEKELGLGFGLYFKCESQNPTGSFKDRGSSVEIARAMEAGAGKVVCASTGNMGASLSAYSAMAGLDCSVLTPSDTRTVKLEQILAYGAGVYRIRGDYTKAASLAEEIHASRGVYLLGDYVYRREGTKSVGFEICEQLKDTDYVFSPVGNGTLISATWKAFREFRTLRIARKLPRMAGIQASTCNPLARAWGSGSEIRPLRNPHTVAVAMECGDPIDGERALDAIRESEGLAASVSDRDILRAREMLSRREGIFAEPAGAASLAGMLKSRDEVERGSRVVCLVTGHGLKSPHTGVKGTVKNSLPKSLSPAEIRF